MKKLINPSTKKRNGVHESENLKDNAFKKKYLEQFFEAHPKFRVEEFTKIWPALLPDMVLKKWQVFGKDMALIFLSYNGLVALDNGFDFYRRGCLGRFSKTLLLEWDTLKIVSLGLPMMATVDSKKTDIIQKLSECPKPSYVEKLDGVCLLATKNDDGYIVKSRRSIYFAEKSLKQLLMIQDFDFGKQIQALIDGEWSNLGPFSVVFECVFPHPYFHQCENKHFASLLGASPHFTPYVAYHKEAAYLTSIIRHNGEFVPQFETGLLAKKYELPRPAVFDFKSVEDAQLFLKSKSNHEGLIVYIDEDQTPLKWKTRWYKNTMRVSSSFYQMKTRGRLLTESPSSPEPYSPRVVSSKIDGVEI
jgi:hypothetical protein